MAYVDKIIDELRGAGFSPTFEPSDDPLVVDDNIRLSAYADIQVCEDGALGLAVRSLDNADVIEEYPYVDTVAELLEQIKEYQIEI